MKPALVFDLNGTLLDISALDHAFKMLFGDARVRKDWFSEVLKIALATTAMGVYADFGRIIGAALKVIEKRQRHSLSEEQRSEVLHQLRALPPFPDVKEGLEELRRAGFPLAVLTNSSLDAAKQALEHAQLGGNFTHTPSADSAQRLKPAREPYQMTASELGIGLDSLMLVAAHAWDVAGALSAGCQACFVARPGEFLDEITPRPTLVVSDLRELAKQIRQV
jgi:2-haloacid dehalogenase